MVVGGFIFTIIIVALTIIFAVVCHYFIHRYLLDDKVDNEVAGVLVHLVGILYAVLIAFVAVTSWGDFDRAISNAKVEVNSLSDLYRVVHGFSPESRDRIRKDIIRYGNLMKNEEWPAMQKGLSSNEAARAAEDIVVAVETFSSETLSQSNLHQDALTLLHSFMDARRLRIAKINEGLPSMLWTALIVGAALTIGLTFFLYVKNRFRQLLMTAILAALIGILLSLVYEFEYPYKGEIIVPDTAWDRFEQTIKSGNIR